MPLSRALAGGSLAWLIAAAAGAERLPVRVYTLADGLAGDQINALHEDARGFLWIATDTGVSRFDGAGFTTFDETDGLPAGKVTDFAETADGTLWLATAAGFARLRQRRGADASAFEYFPADLSSGRFWPALAADPAGGLWMATPRGLVHASNGEPPELRTVPLGDGADPAQIAGLAVGLDGSLWIAAAETLLRRFPDGRVASVLTTAQHPDLDVRRLVCDRAGRVWAGTTRGVFVLAAEGGAELAFYDQQNGLPLGGVNALAAARGDAVWVGAAGLVRFAGTRRERTVRAEQGLAELTATALLEDRDGHLWVGSPDRGVARIAHGGFVSYGPADGLANDRIASVFEAGGELHVITSGARLYRFDGERFVDVSPPELAHARHPSWGSHQLAVRDLAGEWWLPTAQGLLRYAAGADLRRARPKAIYREGAGLPGDDVHRVWLDSAGGLWVTTLAAAGPLVKWDPAAERFTVVPEVQAQFAARNAPAAFAEDRAGDLWLGFANGGLGRRRPDGRWQFFGAADGVPAGIVWDLHCDRRGRLWAATSMGGVGRIDDPAAERPRITVHGFANGLSADSVDCVTEDDQGRLYFGTKRGVDRLEPETGAVRSFTTEDGLPSSRVHVCRRARDGELWFGTLHGLARFDPRSTGPSLPRRVWIESVRLGGVAQPLPAAGTSAVADLVLGPAPTSLRVEYLAIGRALGETVLYQVRLAGDDPAWSPPRSARAVEYPRLAPGRYRLEIRAVSAEAVVGEPATVEFRVLAPLWRRPWFQLLAAVAAVLAGLAVQRARMARAVAVERMRTRIAADLHDDVGSSLSQIAFLSDVAQTGTPGAAPQVLRDIGAQARQLIDTTSDIVWSIDPRRDDLGSLLARLRWFGSELAAARGLRLAFDLPENAAAVALSPEERRELYLLLKEALHNVFKHAAARQAWVRLDLAEGEIRAEVADDGVGFVRASTGQGHGLASLEARAERLGGRLEIDSAPGAGTRLRLRAPLGGRRTSMRLSRPRPARHTAPRGTTDGEPDAR